MGDLGEFCIFCPCHKNIPDRTPTTMSLWPTIPIIEIGFLTIKIEITTETIISYVDEAFSKL